MLKSQARNKGRQKCRLPEANDEAKVRRSNAQTPVSEGHPYSEQDCEDKDAGTVDELN